MGRRRNEKHVFTADEIGITLELTWLGCSHDPMFKPMKWLMVIPIYSSQSLKALINY